MIKKVLIGADPELFFINKDKEVVSAEGLIGGSKINPKSISDNGHYIQEDNVMVEYNIPPCKSLDEFIDNNNFVIDHIRDIAELNNLDLYMKPSATLDRKYLITNQGSTFGCESDFNIYTKKSDSVKSIKGNIRLAGGHIHIGWDNPEFKDKENLVKALDLFLALPFLWLDSDNTRRDYYGNPGRFRFKEYGIEYRTLSNHWISSNELMEFVYNQVMQAVDFVNNNGILPDNLKEIIEKRNIKEAKKIFASIKLIKK